MQVCKGLRACRLRPGLCRRLSPHPARLGAGLQQGMRGRRTMLRRAWREAFCGTTSEEKHMTRPDSLLDSSFDLFVIGGGSGGVRAARMAAQRGAHVALTEDSRMAH